VALFNATSGAVNPSFEGVHMGFRYPDVMSVVMLVVVALGAALLPQHRHCCWETWVKGRGWGWYALFTGSLVSLFGVVTQRPRPSYMFLMTLALMAVVGLALTVIAHHGRLSRHVGWLVPVGVAGLLLIVPSYYTLRFYPNLAQHGQRPLRRLYYRLLPYREHFARRMTVVVLPNTFGNPTTYGDDLCAYLGQNDACHAAATLDQLMAQRRAGETLGEALDRAGSTLLYLDERVLTSLAPEIETFDQDRQRLGWELLGSGENPGDRWRLFGRSGAGTQGSG